MDLINFSFRIPWQWIRLWIHFRGSNRFYELTLGWLLTYRLSISILIGTCNPLTFDRPSIDNHSSLKVFPSEDILYPTVNKSLVHIPPSAYNHYFHFLYLSSCTNLYCQTVHTWFLISLFLFGTVYTKDYYYWEGNADLSFLFLTYNISFEIWQPDNNSLLRCDVWLFTFKIITFNYQPSIVSWFIIGWWLLQELSYGYYLSLELSWDFAWAHT